ncbi:hypothetical protein FDN13_08390 [Caloramator sp. E03]|uniref:hypothetical protein n=1 Tax=Caloramator sp. E03 TaxID=2576307 RepID=UPI0011107CAF|nr:hypothetical protein [Caloramator sp. E03]QCX33717.1 hypothetical protein FDN13_08390 [Caloramator sp. E03]
MDSSLVVLLEDIKRKIDKSAINENKKEKYKKELENLIFKYRQLGVPNNHKETYESLLKKGRELMKDANINDKGKIEYYLRYCNAALYDFNENLKPLNRIVLSYMLTCILFFALSPQYFSYILPLIMIIPIYLGLKGVRNRSFNGLLYALSCIPMALLTSVAWLWNAFLASKNFGAYIEALSKQFNKSPETARNLIIIFVAMSFILLASSLYTLIMGIKYRKMFV